MLMTGGIISGPTPKAVAAQGQLELRITDAETGQPMAALMELRDQRGRLRRMRGIPTVGHAFVVDGVIVFKLPPGNYTFSIECGPEYLPQTGNFQILSAASDNHTVSLTRFVDMKALGWRSIEFVESADIDRLEIASRAADLQLILGSMNVPLPWQERKSVVGDRLYDLRGTYVAHGLLGLFCSKTAFSDPPAAASQPGPTSDLGPDADLPPEPREATAPRAWKEKPQADSPLNSAPRLLRRSNAEASAVCIAMDASVADLPMWIASGGLDAVNIGLPTPRKRGKASVAAKCLRSPDALRYPGRRGAARWREFIYYQLLEAGIRLPALATQFASPTQLTLGQMRTYVFVPPTQKHNLALGDEVANALHSGRVMLSGGPLIIGKINGQPPGTTFDGIEEESMDLRPTLTLHTRQKISYLELVKNGDVIEQIRLDEWVQRQGVLPAIPFTESGWMLVRAVIDAEDDYRFACTGPCYVQFDGQARSSKAAVQFFLDWAEERAQADLDPMQRRFHKASIKFWKKRLDEANVP